MEPGLLPVEHSLLVELGVVWLLSSRRGRVKVGHLHFETLRHLWGVICPWQCVFSVPLMQLFSYLPHTFISAWNVRFTFLAWPTFSFSCSFSLSCFSCPKTKTPPFGNPHYSLIHTCIRLSAVSPWFLHIKFILGLLRSVPFSKFPIFFFFHYPI